MAAREVFADTPGLYAVDRRDFHHAAAAAWAGDLSGAGRTLVTTDYIVAETLNLAVARRGRFVADRALDLFERSRGIRVERIGAERFETAKAFFRRHADHDYSFTDCTSFVVMRELKIVDALTTDGHFAEAGFRPLLPVV